MVDVPEAEAIALLSRPLTCEDAPGWSLSKLKPGLATLECGLISEERIRSGLHLQLIFSRSLKARVVNFKFTVFKMNLGASQRIYQVQVNAVARKPKNWHDLVHEHMGDAKIPGSDEWLSWGFQEAIGYFSKRANITFLPPIPDPDSGPEQFELT